MICEQKGGYGKSSDPRLKNTLGVKSLRISLKYGSYPEPCENFEIGEVEDYLVEFVGEVNKHSDFVGKIEANNQFNTFDYQYYNVTIKNIGDLKGYFDYDIYLSVDSIYSNDDTYIGGINNRNVNLKAQDSIVFLNKLIISKYWLTTKSNLIIKIKGDLNESNVLNNESCKSINIELPPLPTCSNYIPKGIILCHKIDSTTGNIELYQWQKGIYTKTILTINGKLISSNIIPNPVEDSILIRNKKVIKKLANGSIAYSKSIDSMILNNFQWIDNVLEFTDGSYLIMGGKTGFRSTDGNYRLNNDTLITVFTDTNLKFKKITKGIYYRYVTHYITSLPNNRYFTITSSEDPYNNTQPSYSNLIEKKDTNLIDIKSDYLSANALIIIPSNYIGNFQHFIENSSYSNSKYGGSSFGFSTFSIDSLKMNQSRSTGNSGGYCASSTWNRFFNNQFLPDAHVSCDYKKIKVIYGCYVVDEPNYNFLQINLKSKSGTVKKLTPYITYDYIVQTGGTTCLIIGSRFDSLYVVNPDCINPLAFGPDFTISAIPIFNSTMNYNYLSKLKFKYAMQNIGNKNISTTHTIGVYLTNIQTKTKSLIKEINFNNIS